MQFNNGVKPTIKVDEETIKSEAGDSRILFNGQSGIYTYGHKYYIIGENVFLEYEDIDTAKEDLFGKREFDMFEQNMEEDVLVDMIQLPGLPATLSSFSFPSEMDEYTELYFDEDLCYWFLDEGDFRKTLFSSAEEGVIPEVSYIMEYNKEYFVVSPIEFSVKGRFSSIEEALQVTDYAVIGTEPYEEIDYVSVCLLDRKANDEEVDYIADAGLFDFIEINADYEGSYEQDDGMNEICSYDIFEFFDGYFVLDYKERAVLGKFSSYESAFDGAKEEYGADCEDEECEDFEEDEN